MRPLFVCPIPSRLVAAGLCVAGLLGCTAEDNAQARAARPGSAPPRAVADPRAAATPEGPVPAQGGNAASPDLSVRDANRYPTRLASGADGRIYASDSRANAVFVYDAHLNLVAQLGGLDRPLGVAADARGRIYVGSAGRRAIEVYAPDGAKLFDMGAGGIAMPNDLALDRHGNVVVADSASNRVGVYTAEGAWLRDVGAGDPEGLRFPAALACSAGRAGGEELFVADQGHSKVKVYGPDGTFLRAFGGPAPAFSTEYKGRFVRLQSLALDPQGRLHAADSAVARIQILDARTGAWVDDYGAFGTQIGRLNLPLDILVRDSGDVLVANAENHRVELLASPGGRRKEGVKP